MGQVSLRGQLVDIGQNINVQLALFSNGSQSIAGLNLVHVRSSTVLRRYKQDFLRIDMAGRVKVVDQVDKTRLYPKFLAQTVKCIPRLNPVAQAHCCSRWNDNLGS